MCEPEIRKHKEHPRLLHEQTFKNDNPTDVYNQIALLKRAFPKLMGLKRIVVGDPSDPWTSSEEFESFAQDNLEESYTDVIQSTITGAQVQRYGM